MNTGQIDVTLFNNTQSQKWLFRASSLLLKIPIALNVLGNGR